MLSGRNLLAKITDRLLDNEPLRELFFKNPDAALAAYHLAERDMGVLRRLKDYKALEAANLRFSGDTRKGVIIAPSTPDDALEEASAEGKARIVNTGFSSNEQPQSPLPNQPLTGNTDYYFWLEVGEPIMGSIELVPTSLPDELPVNARLQVALFGFESEFTLTSDAEVGELQIMSDGSVKVARDAHIPSPLLGENDLLDRRLFFPVQTPAQAGAHRLRCNIYYQQNLIQSRLVTMYVDAAPPANSPALISALDYNLSRSLNGRQLQGMGENKLSMLLN
ncbi:MAG: hypothetical protein GY943_04810, partial [Chloroflexi bacterium]|nr:hypothetical protein [Chloroflexota bacterium]